LIDEKNNYYWNELLGGVIIWIQPSSIASNNPLDIFIVRCFWGRSGDNDAAVQSVHLSHVEGRKM